MAKEATLQVRMDADLKESVEALYRDMGMTFSEAVRIFAKQSLVEKGMPFLVTAQPGSAFGIASKYANQAMMSQESNALANAMVHKHEAD